MATQGYVYALINQSIKGLVKIGKTTKLPEERAAELSAATGVPTPFHVAYEELFSDCDLAERTIHTILQDQGFRINDRREFFGVPLKQVIKAFQRVFDDIGGVDEVDCTDNCNDDGDMASSDDEPYWVHCHLNGDINLLGINDLPVDLDEAIEWYEKAAALGSPFAYFCLGKLFLTDLNNKSKAMKYFKLGIKAGDERCLGQMFMAYTAMPFQISDLANAEKYANLYFESEAFEENIDFRSGIFSFRSEFAWDYAFKNSWMIKNNIISEIKHIDKIRAVIHEYDPVINGMIANGAMGAAEISLYNSLAG